MEKKIMKNYYNSGLTPMNYCNTALLPLQTLSREKRKKIKRLGRCEIVIILSSMLLPMWSTKAACNSASGYFDIAQFNVTPGKVFYEGATISISDFTIVTDPTGKEGALQLSVPDGTTFDGTDDESSCTHIATLYQGDKENTDCSDTCTYTVLKSGTWHQISSATGLPEKDFSFTETISGTHPDWDDPWEVKCKVEATGKYDWGPSVILSQPIGTSVGTEFSKAKTTSFGGSYEYSASFTAEASIPGVVTVSGQTGFVLGIDFGRQTTDSMTMSFVSGVSVYERKYYVYQGVIEGFVIEEEVYATKTVYLEGSSVPYVYFRDIVDVSSTAVDDNTSHLGADSFVKVP
jgi:hypothetical protein